jgi:hypothetical protein
MQVGTYPTRSFAQRCYRRDTSRGRIRDVYQRGLDISANLCASPRSSDYIFIRPGGGARRIVSEDSESAMCSWQRIDDLVIGDHRPLRSRTWSFLLIVCTLRIFTASQIASDLADEYRGILRRSSI